MPLITTEKLFETQPNKKTISTEELFGTDLKQPTPIKTSLLQEGLIKPAKTFYGGTLKAAAGTADLLDFYSDKLARTFGQPETKNSIFEYLRNNWSYYGDKLQKEGLSKGVIQKIYSGLGQAGFEVPKLMAMGPEALAISGAAEGYKEGGIKGAVTGAIGGKVMKGIIKGIGTLPAKVKYPTAFGIGAVTEPGGLEEKVAGGTRFTMLSIGKSPTKEEFERTLEYSPLGKVAKSSQQRVKEATNIIRNVINPSKEELKNIEIRKGKNIDEYFKLFAQEQLPLNQSSDKKLDTSEARTKINEKIDKLNPILEDLLKSDSSKRFDLEKLRIIAKRELREKIKNDTEFKSAEKDIDEFINDTTEVRGRYLNGEELNNFKQGMWSLGYNMMRPTAQSNARKLGFIAKEMIEKGYPDYKVKQLNDTIGKYITLKNILENSHGRVIKGGRLGKYFGHTIGAIAGSYIPVAGTLGGAYLGGKVVEYIQNPQRLAQKAANIYKRTMGKSGKIESFKVEEDIPTISKSELPIKSKEFIKREQIPPQLEYKKSTGNEIIVYYRTNIPIEQIKKQGFKSLENTNEIFVSNQKSGQAIGYGKNIIKIKVKSKDLRLDDEFPNGEKHFAIKKEIANKALRNQIIQKK